MHTQDTNHQPARQFRHVGLVHLEKSGPAFRGDFLPLSVADQLGASLVAQTQVAIGDCFNAIQRKCFLDLMPAWSRLLRISGVTPNGQRRTALRRDWFWDEAKDAIIMALVRCETEHAAARWLVADMLIRGEAAQFAADAELNIAKLREEQSMRRFASAETLAHERLGLDALVAQVARNHAAYRAFAEGRA